MIHDKQTLPSNRVWEIDAVRGLLILGLLCKHLYTTVYLFCINGYYNIDSYQYVNLTDPLRFWFDWGPDGKIYQAFLTPQILQFWGHSGVCAFFVISGICCLFSRNNFRQGFLQLIAAFAVSGFTKIIDLVNGMDAQFIRFGVLHCYGYCHLIYYFLFEKRSNRTLLITAALVMAIGYYLRYCNPIYVNTSLLLPFGFREADAAGRDYWPIFPMLGWLLIGVVIGRKFYSEKQSLAPFPRLERLTRPLQFLGRHSGKIYFGHIFVYTAVFCGIGWLFGLL